MSAGRIFDSRQKIISAGKDVKSAIKKALYQENKWKVDNKKPQIISILKWRLKEISHDFL